MKLKDIKANMAKSNKVKMHEIIDSMSDDDAIEFYVFLKEYEDWLRFFSLSKKLLK